MLVYLIVDLIRRGHSPAEIVDDYPELTVEDVDAAVSFDRREHERG
jgi:uncharacterized protein (DUF433 family)